MGFFDTVGKTVGSWIKHRAEDFKFWYGKAKDDFSNGRPLSGFKNIAVGTADILLQGEITDIYQEDLKPALHTNNLEAWKKEYMGENADPNSLSSIYHSMADYSRIMAQYTRSIAVDNGMENCKDNLKEYLKGILNDNKEETSPYLTELLTSQKIKGNTDIAYHDLLKEYEDTLSLADNDAKTEKQNAIIDKIADEMFKDTDSMIAENGTDKMLTFYENAYDNYSQENRTNERYEASLRELGIVAEKVENKDKTEEKTDDAQMGTM